MDIINILLVAFAIVFVLIVAMTLVSRYRMCPPDRILVVYGKLANGLSSKCYHGGSTFVMPMFQSYSYLDLTPINIEIELRGALSSQNIRIDAPASFSIGISTEPEVMQNAATRLLGRTLDEVQQLASDQRTALVVKGQLEQIGGDGDLFMRDCGLVTGGRDSRRRHRQRHRGRCFRSLDAELFL